jgi:acetyl-CoA carboxylase biotin carboxylase subunit
MNSPNQNSLSSLSFAVSPLSSILIANRGEIASRIIRTCRKMGIRSIVVFSEADRNAPFVAEADQAVFIGESSPAQSYLDQDKIIAVAKRTQADAIHPGYGFLAENAAFARRCAEEGIIFIGPHPEAIEAMGSKSAAKSLMQKHGVPVVPGYQGADQSVAKLKAEAKKIGYPVLLKATAGGGGKGMRIVRREERMAAAVEAAKREALNAFGSEELILEKYIDSGRHIEFQIFGDRHGSTVHLLERECTIQRRYQKIVEESPSPVMTEELRQRMGEAAVRAAEALQYDNAGTVEFIYDEASGEFYFLEVNTRLQVEHPVTEALTGLDLVQMQIESAQGLPLSLKQESVRGEGYAIELRLYAEDPSRDFAPVTGRIERFEFPEVEGLRVETAVQSGSEISIYYDPMIAKLIVWDQNRSLALRKMHYVLGQLVCLGITTNQGFLRALLADDDFRAGRYDTHFVEQKHENLITTVPDEQHLAAGLIAATLHGWQQRESTRTLLRSLPSGWRNSFFQDQQLSFFLGEAEYLVQYRYQNQAFVFRIFNIGAISDSKPTPPPAPPPAGDMGSPSEAFPPLAGVQGVESKSEKRIAADTSHSVRLISSTQQELRVEIDGLQYGFQVARKGLDLFLQNELTGTLHLSEKERFPQPEKQKEKGAYEAPMPSQIVQVLVEEGQSVKEGDKLLVLSSMKMENTLYAEEAGTVEAIYAQAGSNVEAGFLLLKIAEIES